MNPASSEHVSRQTQAGRRSVGGEELSSLVSNYERSWFRLETLDRYIAPSEQGFLGDFLEGSPLPFVPQSAREWFQKIATDTSLGKEVARVHIVPRSLSPYLRYEIEWCYAQLCDPHGEKVFLLIREESPHLASLANEDFYLFDDSSLIFVNYDQDGRCTGYQREVSQASIDNIVRLKQDLIADAMPLKAFLKRMRNSKLLIE